MELSLLYSGLHTMIFCLPVNSSFFSISFHQLFPNLPCRVYYRSQVFHTNIYHMFKSLTVHLLFSDFLLHLYFLQRKFLKFFLVKFINFQRCFYIAKSLFKTSNLLFKFLFLKTKLIVISFSHLYMFMKIIDNFLYILAGL